MAIDQVLISKSPGETRIALLSDGQLDRFSVVRAGRESVFGNIYLGRVEGALPGLDAAFVNIGLERAGFLALPEARPPDSEAAGRGKDGIRDYANDGDRILVQVQRDPIENKGAKLTTHINLAGVTLVLRPGQPGVSISRRITGVADRDRLTAVTGALVPEGGGFIVRKAAAAASSEAIERDARDLVSRWREIGDEAATAKPPQRLHTEPESELLALRELGGAEIGKSSSMTPRCIPGFGTFAPPGCRTWFPLLKPTRARTPFSTLSASKTRSTLRYHRWLDFRAAALSSSPRRRR